MPSEEEILMTYYNKRNHEKRMMETQMAAKSGQAFPALQENIGKKARNKSIVLLILGALLGIFTGGWGLILAIILCIIIYAYYYGIKKTLTNRRVANNKYRCTHCRHIFIGPHTHCPKCGKSLTCDTNIYKCGNCGQTFVGLNYTCPRCKAKIYYE